MSPFFAEFLGTALLVLFGNGVVANVVLARTKGNNAAGWSSLPAGASRCSSQRFARRRSAAPT